MAKELAKSTSNLNDIVYSGRPRNEEPHVKKSMKKKTEKVEYIVRVDLEELNIDDEVFDDLQSLYQLFDLDKDGILNFKEFEKLLRIMGYRLGEEQAQSLAGSVSVDNTNFSVSFNEFLKLFSLQQQAEPDEETLVDMFASFDKDNVGMIRESLFKKIMSAKDDVSEEDIEEMLTEYYRLAKLKEIPNSKPEGAVDLEPDPPPTPHPNQKPTASSSDGKRRASSKSGGPGGSTSVTSNLDTDEDNEKWIDYKEFAAMLQQ